MTLLDSVSVREPLYTGSLLQGRVAK